MYGFWSGATDAGREGKWGWQDSMTPVGDFFGWSEEDTFTNCMVFNYY